MSGDPMEMLRALNERRRAELGIPSAPAPAAASPENWPDPMATLRQVSSAQRQRVEGYVSSAEEAAPFLDRAVEINARQRAALIQTPQIQRAEMDTLKKQEDLRRQARGQVTDTLQTAARFGTPAQQARAEAAIQQANKSTLRRAAETAYEMSPIPATLTGAKLLMSGLDYMQGKVRNLTTPGVEASWNADVTPEQWNRAIEKKAKEDPVSAAGAFYYPTQFAGDVVGGVIGGGLLAPLFMGADALNKTVKGEPLTPPNDPDYWKRQLKETVGGAQESAGDLTRQMVSDPLSLLSFGAGGAAKTAGIAATRALARAGIAGEDAVRALVPFMKVMSTEFGTKEGTLKAMRALELGAKQAGLDEAAAQALVKEVAGDAGQFLGRGGLRLEVPFTHKGVDVRIPGTKENAIRRAIEESRPGQAYKQSTGGHGIFSREVSPLPGVRGEWVAAEQRMARAAERGHALALADEARQLMTELHGTGQTEASVRDLLLRHIDPAFDMSAFGMTPEIELSLQRAVAARSAPPSAVKAGQQVFVTDGKGGWVAARVDGVANGQAALRYTEGPLAGQVTQAPRAALRPRKPLDRTLGGPDLTPLVQQGLVPEHAKLILHEGQWKVAAPRADYRPPASLSPQEREAVAKIEAYFARRSKEIVKEGGEEFSRNLISNQYIPRIYSAKHGALEEVIPKQYTYSPMRARKTLRPDENVSQPGGLPLGAANDAVPASYLEGKMNLSEILATYNSRHARTLARRGLEDRIAKQFAVDFNPQRGIQYADMHLPDGSSVRVPAFAANAARETLDRSLMTFGGFLRSKGVGQTFYGRAGLAAVDAMEAAKGVFKRNVLSRVPGYHLLNTTNDFQQMFAAGVDRPLKRWRQASEALKGKPITINGKLVAAEDVLAKARAQNIAVDDIGHLDLDVLPGEGQARMLGRVLEGKAPESAARKVYDADLRFGEYLTNRARLGMFIDGLERGMSPVEAATRTFDALIDYAALPVGLQVARWVMPFATWAAKSPGVTARALLRHPARVANMPRALEEFLGDQSREPLEPPRYVQERGWTVPLRPNAARALGNLREAAGGTPYDPGVQSDFLPRFSVFDEALNLPVQLAQGNVDPLTLSMGGLPKFVQEFAQERDLMTKKDLRRISPGAVFPAGTPYVPDELVAKEGQANWLRYLAPYIPVLGAPPVAAGINRAIWETDPVNAPYATVGTTRPYAPQLPGNQWFYTMLNLLTRMPFYETLPSAAVRNATDRPEVKQLGVENRDQALREKQRQRLQQ